MFENNLHIYPSNLKNESRLFKEANTVTSYKLVKKVIAVGLKDSNTLKFEQKSSKFEIHRIWIPKIPGPSIFNFLFKYFFFQICVLIKVKGRKIDVINAHNLSVLPIAVVLKKLKKAKLIYDAHELETEVHNSKGIKRKYGKWIERKLIYSVDQIIVVNDSIKEWYAKEYGLTNIYSVRNIPNSELYKDNKKYDIFREKFNIPKEKIIFLYQGLISQARGIDIILDAFKSIEENKVLVLMGFGPDVNRIKSDYVNEHVIFYHEAVPRDELVAYTKSADIGFSLIENTCLNHYYCLPNKAFEYYLSKIPQVTSDFPELNKLICENEVGWCIEPNKSSLYNLISKITKEDVKIKTDKLSKIWSKYSWQKEEKEIIKLYQNLLND